MQGDYLRAQAAKHARRERARRAVGAVEHDSFARKRPFAARNEKIGVVSPLSERAAAAAGERRSESILVETALGALLHLFGDLAAVRAEYL